MGNDKNIDAIYIHIPFCSKKCEYCDFCTFINMQKEYGKYVDYLIKEIRMHTEYRYDTIYFGGGTPSLLPIGMIKDIMSELKWTENAEITLELNPTDITLEKLSELRKAGVNRLSIGIQSFQEHVLKFIGREHSSEEAVSTYRMARKAGFENITVDLMFGIPNQTLEDLQKDLEIIKALSPENISIYSLIWEEGTVFWSKLKKGILSCIDEDLEAEMYEHIMDFLERNGYNHYEISNFSKKGCEGRHNIKYWKNREFIGVGLGSASYFRGKRYSNTKIFRKYYENIGRKHFPIDEKTVEIIDEQEKLKLDSILGLRLVKEGIGYFSNEAVEKLIKDKLIEKVELEEKSRLRLTKKGILIANNVFAEFI